jgi:lysophospholipase L1-like esterase
VELVIPIALGLNDAVTALNGAIRPWVQYHSTAASPISIADCSTGFPATGLRDGVHPSDDGDAFIAARIFPVLLQAIKSSLEGSSLESHQHPLEREEAPVL